MSEKQVYLRPLGNYDESALEAARQEIIAELNLGHTIGSTDRGGGEGLHLMEAVIKNEQVSFQDWNYDKHGGKTGTVDQSVSRLESIADKHGLKVVVE